MLVEIIIGLLGALPLLLYGKRKYSLHYQGVMWANALILAAAIYVVFALFGQAWDWLPIELIGVGLYAVPALLARKKTKWWLVLGWTMHVAWDVFLHSSDSTAFVPHWYAGVCIGFDLAVAAYFSVALLSPKKVANS